MHHSESDDQVLGTGMGIKCEGHPHQHTGHTGCHNGDAHGDRIGVFGVDAHELGCVFVIGGGPNSTTHVGAL